MMKNRNRNWMVVLLFASNIFLLAVVWVQSTRAQEAQAAARTAVEKTLQMVKEQPEVYCR